MKKILALALFAVLLATGCRPDPRVAQLETRLAAAEARVTELEKAAADRRDDTDALFRIARDNMKLGQVFTNWAAAVTESMAALERGKMDKPRR